MRIVILLAVVATVVARPNGDYYDKKYDNFDVKELVDNVRLLKAYVLCFLEKGKCTPEGNDFKKWVPEAVQSKCGKCTETQKPQVATFIKAIIEKLPDDWEELSEKYNPKGEYTHQLYEFIQQYAPNE